jgi:hypothetical protein
VSLVFINEVKYLTCACSAHQGYGGFTSGLSIQYTDRVLTDRTYQNLCPGLEIGKRLPLETMIRVADCRPFDLQDILDADAKWRLLFFVGDPRAPGQEDMIQSLARYYAQFTRDFRRLGFKKTKSICEIVTIGAFTGEDKFTYELPDPVKADWTRYAQATKSFGRQPNYDILERSVMINHWMSPLVDSCIHPWAYRESVASSPS